MEHRPVAVVEIDGAEGMRGQVAADDARNPFFESTSRLKFVLIHLLLVGLGDLLCRDMVLRKAFRTRTWVRTSRLMEGWILMLRKLLAQRF